MKTTSQPILLDAGPSQYGWHRLETALRCPRLFAWKQQGLAREISPPLVKGSLLHIGLAHYYIRKQAEQQGTDPERYLSPEDAILALAEKNEEESHLWALATDDIIHAYRAYAHNWGSESWKVISVEEQLKAHVGPKQHPYTQRADLIVEEADGRVWIVDHKSAYRINSKTLTQYIMDGQFIGYQMFGHAKYKERFGGVILNRVKLSQPYDFDRRALEPAPQALRHFTQVIIEGERRIAQGGDKPPEEWPMTLTNQVCFGKYGQCPAYNLCRFGGE